MLSSKGAEVLVGARDMVKCERLASQVWAVSGFVRCEYVDLADQKSVLNFTEQCFGITAPEVHILCMQLLPRRTPSG